MNADLIPRPQDRIICLKVGKIRRNNLYEMTRKFWKIKLERAVQATHVLAVSEGEVVAVYLPKAWEYTKDPRYLGRVEFVGTELHQSDYIGKNVSDYYGRSSNPVKYINM